VAKNQSRNDFLTNTQRLTVFYTRLTIINVINTLLKLHYRQITKPIFD